MKLKIYMLIIAIFMLSDVSGQIGRFPLSPVQKIEQHIGMTDITVQYSRPSQRGRTIFGDLVPYNKLWRTGANRSTTIEFNQDVIINQERVKKGKYAIFSIPNPDNWEMVFYSKTDNWDVPELIDSTLIVATIVVPTVSMSQPLEALAITIGDFTNFTFNLNIAWDKTMVSIPIELTNRELMNKKISNELNGPTAEDYYSAAEYQMEAGKDYEQGLEWINSAIATAEEVTWWEYRIKAILLMELGRKKEALEVAEHGMQMAVKVNREYGINEFNKILKKLGK